MSDLKYKNTILDFSLLLNAAQKPIQILDAIKWNDDIEDFIIKNKFKEMPKIDYRDRPLKYDPEKKLQEFKGFLYLGRGVSYPIALEGALKLKELAYMHAEGYAAGEMKHGPLALIDDNMAIVVVAPSDELLDKTISNLQEAKARGGKIISIGTGENKSLKTMSEYYLSLPNSLWTTNPIISVVPLQLMSYHLAHSLGYDVDQPRNLAKSVTVE